MAEEIDTSTSQLPAEVANGELQIHTDALPDRVYAAQKITDPLPPAAYERIGQNALTLDDKQIAEMEAPTPDDEVDIRPDNGAVYASHEYYRRKLNKVFGYLGWTLIPGSPLMQRPNTNEWYRCWVLFINGVYVSEAIASRQLHDTNAAMDLSDVAESIKSDALRRCCKDLGIATECWNKRWVQEWKKRSAIQVIAPVWKKGQQVNSPVWRRKDADPFPGERGPATASTSNSTSSASGNPAAATRTTPPPEKSAPASPGPQASSAKPSAGASSGEAPKSASPASASPAAAKPSGGMRITDGQIRLLWVKARNAKLVVEKDATLWIDWLHNHDAIDIPEVEGRTTEEVAAEMMKAVQGSRFTKLLKDLDAAAKAEG